LDTDNWQNVEVIVV